MGKSSKEEVEELNAALSVANQSPIQGTTFKVHDVDFLEVEVLPLPIVDTSLQFMYRFSKPIPMVLTTVPIKLSHKLTQVDNRSYEEILKEALLLVWKKEILDSCDGDIDNIPDIESREIIQKYHDLTEVKLFTLDLVRDENSER